PGHGPRVTRLGPPELGLLATLHGRAFALLVHLLEGLLGIGPARLLLVKIRDFAVQLAGALDQILGRRRLAFAALPEAQPDHLFQDDLVLRAFADAVVQLLANVAAYERTSRLEAHTAEIGGRVRGVRRLAFVRSRDWTDPLEAGTPPVWNLGSTNPNCKIHTGGSAGPVKIGPVTLCQA